MPTPRRSLLEESDDWDNKSLTELLDESDPVDAVIIDRRKPKKPISIRVDPDFILVSKKIALQWGMGYQTLFRFWLMQGLRRYYSNFPPFEFDEEESELEPTAHAGA